MLIVRLSEAIWKVTTHLHDYELSFQETPKGTRIDPGGREGFYITCHSKLPETLRKILQVLYRKILFFTCPSWPHCHQKEQGWGTGGGALPLQNIDPQPTSGPSQRALCLKGLNFLGYHSSHPNMSRKHPFPYTSLQTPLSPACP